MGVVELRTAIGSTPILPGPSPSSSHVTPPAPQTSYPNTQHFDSPPMRSPNIQHFDSPPRRQDPVPSSPVPPNPRIIDVPSSPESPSFATPPSSPPVTEAPAALPQTPTLPRRSTRVKL